MNRRGTIGMRDEDMTFKQKYEALEQRFKEQVEKDNRDLKIEGGYVHNFVPRGPVDYVLIAMEPSTGVLGKDRKDPYEIDRNFSWSVEDFILHHCIRNWLCRDGESYHLTDLAKGGMKTRLAGVERRRRYDRWYDLLTEELRLLSKGRGTRIITIGKVVADYLEDKHLCGRVERILHYTRNAASHRDREIRPWQEDFLEFSRSVNKDSFQQTIEEVLEDADMCSYANHRPEGGGTYNLTESRKKLMFLYKMRFSELRTAPHIVLNS